MIIVVFCTKTLLSSAAYRRLFLVRILLAKRRQTLSGKVAERFPICSPQYRRSLREHNPIHQLAASAGRLGSIGPNLSTQRSVARRPASEIHVKTPSLTG